MKKIKKIREIRPKIKIIEKQKEKNSGLVEDIEQAEEDFREEIISSSTSKTNEVRNSPGPVTQIQQETGAIRELDEANIRKTKEYAKAESGEIKRNYAPSQMSSPVLLPERRISSRNISGPSAKELISINQTEMSGEREDRYKIQESTAKEKRKIYPWER